MNKLENLKKKCKGLDIVLVTPFKENGDLDIEALKYNLKYYVENLEGKDVLITPTGSCGEFPLLTEEEHKKIIKITVEEVAGRLPVIAGAGLAGTVNTINMCKYAEEVGADGVQLITPYYFVPTEEGMYQHFKTIAENINIGMIIYNNPAFSKSWINPQLMKKLAMIDNILGVKENTPHLMLFESMIKTLSDTDMAVFCGMGEKWFSYLSPNNLDGMVSSFANFAPLISYKLYEAAKNRDFKKVFELKNIIDPYFSFLGKMAKKYGPDTGMLPKPGGVIYGEGNIRFGVIKEAVTLIGLRGGKVRLPLSGIQKEDLGELKQILKKMELI